MHYRWSILLLFLLILYPGISAQLDQPSSQPVQLRVTVNLIQVDAIVTDSHGRQVTDLKAEDFELLQDEAPKQITHFSYVRAQSVTLPAAELSMPRKKGDPPAPPVRIRPEQVTRTIVLMVDDLGLSWESVASVRQGLKKYVREMIQPGDLVALVRTSAGMGALQQFTADRRLLEAAIDEVRWLGYLKAGLSPFQPISDPVEKLMSVGDTRSVASGADMANRSRAMSDMMTAQRRQIFSIGTLGALGMTIQGLRALPGRKSVVLLSEGMPLLLRKDINKQVTDTLLKIADLANRNSVALYSLDVRALQALQPTVGEDIAYLSPAMRDQRLQGRREGFYGSQENLTTLAESAGGFAILDQNDLSKGIREVMADQSGYYLIGYQPDTDTFAPGGDRPVFRKIAVRVKRPGLRVRTRSGFYSIPDAPTPVQPPGREEQLLAAISSPFASSGIGVRLTSLFSHHPTAGSIVRSFIHVDANGLTFGKKADGTLGAVVDVMGVSYGRDSQPIDTVGQTFGMSIDDDQYESALQQGFVYTLDDPIQKPGVYQFRVAVRDSASERIGSASQFIEVPDIAKGQLAMSGIVLRSAGAPAHEEDLVEARSSPAVRVFRQGRPLTYACQILNHKLDRKTGRPQVETQLRIFRNGQPVFEDRFLPVQLDDQQDLKRLASGGILQTGTALEPGEYILQIIARDKLAKGEQGIASQWIDFEIVK